MEVLKNGMARVAFIGLVCVLIAVGLVMYPVYKVSGMVPGE